MATFSTRLRDALDMNGMSAAELSRRTGVSEGSISQYLRGAVLAKQDKIYAISQVLNVTPTWLMAFDDPEDARILTEEVRVLFNSLSTDRQREALQYLHFLAQLDSPSTDEGDPPLDK